MNKITPFLWFDRQCEEAMKFYVDVFNGAPGSDKNSKIVAIKRYPEGPLEEPMKGMEGLVLTGVFDLDGQRFMALDGGPTFKFTGAVSFLVECDTQEKIDHFWNLLTANGGEESQCGWLKDKFGLWWQITPSILGKWMDDKDPVRSDRVMKAFLQMKKIVIADMEKAYEGK